MKKELLVVVDMVNGFVNVGALHDPYINHITPGIKRLIEEFEKNGNFILAFQDCHEIGDKEFENYPIHCLKGSYESELIPELKPFQSKIKCISKKTTNGFLEIEFQKFYQEHVDELERIVVVGCCTDICVTDFTTSLASYHKEKGKEIPIVVPIDLVETFENPMHPRNMYNEIGLETMRKAGIQLITSYEIFKNKQLCLQ